MGLPLTSWKMPDPYAGGAAPASVGPRGPACPRLSPPAWVQGEAWGGVFVSPDPHWAPRCSLFWDGKKHRVFPWARGAGESCQLFCCSCPRAPRGPRRSGSVCRALLLPPARPRLCSPGCGVPRRQPWGRGSLVCPQPPGTHHPLGLAPALGLPLYGASWGHASTVWVHNLSPKGFLWDFLGVTAVSTREHVSNPNRCVSRSTSGLAVLLKPVLGFLNADCARDARGRSRKLSARSKR